MYEIIKETHSIVRWILILVSLGAIYWSWIGFRKGKIWGISESRIVAALSGLVDLQLALGLILYFVLSPKTTAIYGNLLSTVQSPGFILIGVVHPLAMIASAVLLHLIKPQIAKLSTDKERFKKLGILVAIALVLILLAIPWVETELETSLAHFPI